MTWKRIDKELEERISRLMNTKTVKFNELNTADLQAIAFNEPLIGYDGHFYWDQLNIYNNPLVLSEESYKPLNPKDNADFRTTKILIFDYLHIIISEREAYPGFFADLLCRKGEKYMGYDFTRRMDKEGESRVISCETKVIPIYVGNEDFLAVMNYFESRDKNETN